MFDVGFSELLLLAIVALVVLGPEKLPHAARMAGAWVGRIRRTISTMQSEIEREVAAQEVKEQFERQFREMGGHDFVKGVQQEQAALAGSLDEAAQSLRDVPASLAPAIGPVLPAISEPIVVSAPAETPAPYAPEPPPPVLPEAATPPDQVQLDGEQAYREWLASQRRDNRIAPPPRDGEDSPA